MTESPDRIIGVAGRRPAVAVSPATALSGFLPPLIAFGLVLCGVGIVDLGLAWWPLRFGTAEWEFGMASRTFDSLALGTTGFALLVAAAAARNRPVELRVLAAVSLLLVVVLLGVAMLYALNAPVALSRIPDEARSALTRAMTRTTLFAGMYLVLYGWFSWFTWRRAGAATKGVQ